MSADLDWIAVDWGTSTLRAWAISATGAVKAEAASRDGMGALRPGGFEPALLGLIGPWLPPQRAVDVVACGMVGAREGWVEAGYAGVPAPPLAQGLRRAKAADPRLRVFVLGGLSQTRPADVMRGEETQIAGHLALGGTRDGVVVLPGTHTKWVEIKDGAVFHFASFMTGELFALLAERSVLRHAVSVNGTAPGGASTGTNPVVPIGPDPAAPPAGGEPRSLANADRGAQTRTDPRPPPRAEPMAPAAAGLAVRPSAGPNALSSVPEAPLSDAFRSGFEDAMARPERVAGQLFGLRAERLLDLAPPAALGERLSGLLLGIEFAAARPYWLGQDVALVAAGPLAQRYRAAMDLVGLSPAMADPVATVLAGLAAARRQILEERAR